MDTKSKLDIATQKKQSGDQAFKAGDMPAALRNYHESLMYLQGLDKNALESIGIKSPNAAPPADDGQTDEQKDAEKKKEKTIVDEMLEKIYSNMAACQIKNKKWDRAIECANKALAKNEDNHKALYRKAKALAEQGFFDRSKKVFEELKKKNPKDTASIDTEIAHYKRIDDEKEKANSKKLKGFLNKKSLETDA